MTLGNIPLARRNKVDAKILLGYIPSLNYCSESKKKSASFRLAARRLFHRALSAMLRLLRCLSYNGVHLYVNGGLKWFFPYLAVIISDWPEAYAMCATYESSNSLHPCHSCLVDHDMMNNVYLKKENIIIHNENTTKESLCQSIGKQISVHYMRNALWKRP
ncbi:12225_t:CDS:1, partial [Cetraspora pellucida]